MSVEKFKPITIILLLLINSIGYSQQTYKDIIETKYVPIDREVYDIIV